MALIQIELSEDVDKQLGYYMLDNDIKNKKIAIIKILKEQLKK